MNLAANADLSAFLDAVQKCSGDVLFYLPQGDKLNLKSTLSQYLFAALAGKEEMLKKGRIVCLLPQDEKKLAPLLTVSAESKE